MKPTPQSLWGIYLVDVFDNATLIAEIEGAALFEPQPLAARPRPPVIPDRVKPGRRTAEVHIADIYSGPGLQGVPRGTVKRLRVFSYHFGYNAKAGFPLVGTQAGWDVKRVLGTATVEADGSAYFQIPANTPVSIQPLDEEGRAVQLMRSWLVGMPGELVSCVGCHENRRETLPTRRSLAHDRRPEPLEPWYGAPRPFAFAHEVFPVLEQYCIGCHDKPPTVGPRSNPCFKDPDIAYDTLHPYVHRPGVETDMALLNSDGVSRLDQPADPDAGEGTSRREAGRDEPRSAGAAVLLDRLECAARRQLESSGVPELRPAAAPLRTGQAFANNDDDPEGEYEAAAEAFRQRTPIPFVAPPPEEPVQPDGLKAAGFPLTAAEAARLQQANPARSAEGHRPGRRRQADAGLDSRRRVRDGQPRRRAGRTAAQRGPREPALLDGRHRSDQRPVRLVRSAARHAVHRHALAGSRRARPHRQSPRSAGGARLLVGGHAVLRLAEREDGPGASRCPPKPNGNGRPERAPRRSSSTARWTPTSAASPIWPTRRSAGTGWDTTAPVPCSGAIPIRRR